MKRLVSVITLILLIAVLAVGLGVLTNGFKNWNPKDWLNWKSSQETARILDGEGEELTDGAALPAQMVYAAAGATASAPKKITLTATVTPAEATYQGLNWAIEWVNPSSAFAVGKSAGDFVTVAQKTDKSAELSFLAAFGSQIKLTVSAIDNPSASAECLIDCVKSVESAIFTIKHIEKKQNTFSPGEWISTVRSTIEIDSAVMDESSLPYTMLPFYDDSGALIPDFNVRFYPCEISYEIRYGIGTIEDNYELFADLLIAPEFAKILDTNGIAYEKTYLESGLSLIDYNWYTLRESFLSEIFGSNTNIKALRSELAKHAIPHLKLNVVLLGKYGQFGREFNLIFDSESIKVPVNAIELNQGTHVFTD